MLLANQHDLARVTKSRFYSLVPDGPLVYPLVIIATMATVIASQALISGAYSLTRQAVQLGFLPRVHHPAHVVEAPRGRSTSPR